MQIATQLNAEKDPIIMPTATPIINSNINHLFLSIKNIKINKAVMPMSIPIKISEINMSIINHHLLKISMIMASIRTPAARANIPML